MKAKQVQLFVKPHCPWCHQAMDWLDQHGVRYEKLDVVADQRARDKMMALSGQELTPVIDVDGRVLADFGPEELADFWKKIA